MISVTATLDKWTAWAPGIETPEQWKNWAGDISLIEDQGSPKVNFLPAMFRRRLSQLSKLALTSAYSCINDEGPISTVFVSRYGELNTTMKLLEDIANNSPISPTGFSTSVHNTASGMYSIAKKDHSPSTAIAAGVDSLEAGFIEAVCQLSNRQQARVMLVLAEEPLHHHYSQYSDMPEKPFTLALLLSAKEDGMKLSLSSNNLLESPPTKQQHGLSLLQLLNGSKNTLKIAGERLSWNWELSVE